MVVKLRSAVGIGLIWVATVAGVSATAWVAIDRAGRDISGPTVSRLSSLPTSPAAAPRTPATPATSGIGPPPAGETPSSAPPPPPVAIGSATVGSQAPQDRSSSVPGGQISVRCNGAIILLRIAQPDNGWRVAVKEAGPRVVDLTFEGGSEDVAGRTRVTALCDNGTPALTLANTAVPGD